MPIVDWWAELDGKVVESKKIQEASKRGGGNSAFTEAEWAEARAKHKAKMNDAARSS